MRYNLLSAAAAVVALAVSCTVSQPEIVCSPVLGEQEITIVASLGEPDTRTERAADGSVLWSPGDQISLFYGSGENGGSCFTAQNTETAKTVNFTGTIGVITGGNNIAVEDTYFWVVYPYNATASCDGTSITTVLPSEQVATADTFADDLFPSIGRSQGQNMAFYNICGGIKFTVSEEGIKSVTIRSNSGEQIAGKITVGYDDNGLPVVTNIADGTDYVTVAAPAGETLEVGRAYYLVFVPTVFENGFTLTFNKGNIWATYNRTQSTTIRRSVFGSLATPDSGLEWNQMQYVSIPDENFRAYMIQNFDSNGDGEVDELEAASVRKINVYSQNIASLAGIEYLVNLEQLYCGSNSLTSLDVSSNIALKRLSCTSNQLTTLDISNNIALTYLSCAGNQLSALDTSNNTELETLYCWENKLTILDVSRNTALKALNCSNNQLISLDASNLSSLTYITCNNNMLTSINVDGCIAMERLYCYNNCLISVDVTGCCALKKLFCYNNALTSLDVGGNPELFWIACLSNQLTGIDVSDCPALTTLNCSYNQIASLDVSNNTALTHVFCSNNNLTFLNVSMLPQLDRLTCQNNPMQELWLSAYQNLSELSFDSLAAINYVEAGLDSEAPIIIDTAEDLIAFFSNPIHNIELGADIDLNGANITGNNALYALSFDGRGHTISNAVLNDHLFNNLTGSIINVKFSSVQLNNSMIGLATTSALVEDVIFDSNCTISFPRPIDGSNYGGLVSNNAGSIINCSSNATINLHYGSLPNASCNWGGLVGYTTGVVSGCFNGGRVAIAVDTPVSGAYHSLGGIVGIYEGAAGQAMVVNCTNIGSVSVEYGTSVFFCVGGVVGGSPSAKQTPGNYGLVENCSNEGNVSIHYINGGSGASPNIGGVLGYTEGQMRGCTNSGNISILCDSESLVWTGVRIAGVGGTVTRGAYQCHNYGQITVDALCAGGTYGNRGVGNIASCCFAGVVASAGPYTADSSVLFEKCYNHVNLNLTIRTLTETSNHYCGGVFGYATGSIVDSENDGDITITCPTSINRLGGIAGGCCFGVSGCTNRGALELNHPAVTKTDWRSFVGGIVADASKAGATTYSNCINSGNLGFYSTATPSSSKVSALGGIVGCGAADSQIEFSNCSNNGTFEFDSPGSVVTGDLRGGDYN